MGKNIESKLIKDIETYKPGFDLDSITMVTEPKPKNGLFSYDIHLLNGTIKRLWFYSSNDASVIRNKIFNNLMETVPQILN